MIDGYIGRELNKEIDPTADIIITIPDETVEQYNTFDIDEPEQIMIEFTTEGEFAKEFKPQLFLKVTGTDLSRCLIGDRLRVELNSEIYWMRLEKDN